MNKKTKLTNRIVSILSVAALTFSATGVLSSAEAEDVSITGTVKAVGAENSTVDVVVVQKDNGYIAYEGKAENGEICVPKISDGEYTVIVGKTYFASKSYDITVGAETVELNDEISRYGDLNSDGKITTVDVGIVNANAKGVSSLDEYNFKIGDVSLDGKITTVDVGMINAHAKGIKNISTIDPNEILPTNPTEEPTDEPTSEPTDPVTKPKEPQDVGIIKIDSVEKNNNSVTIDYTQAENACGARIWMWEAKSNGNDQWLTIGDPVILSNYEGADTIFKVTGLKPGTTYRYRIKAFNFYYPDGTTQTTSWGEEYWNVFTTTGTAVAEPTDPPTEPVTKPKEPQDVGIIKIDSVEKNNNSATIDYTQAENACGARLWLCESYKDNNDGSNSPIDAIILSNYADADTVFSLTDLKPNTTYYYLIQPFNFYYPDGTTKTTSWGVKYYDIFSTTDSGTVETESTIKQKYEDVTNEALSKLKLWKSKYPKTESELFKKVTIDGEEIRYYPCTPFDLSSCSIDNYLNEYESRDSDTFANNVASGSIAWDDEEEALVTISTLKGPYNGLLCVECFNTDGTLKNYIDAYADPIERTLKFVGNVGDIGKNWIKANIKSTMTTKQKIEKINEYTIQLMSDPSNTAFSFGTPDNDFPYLPEGPSANESDAEELYVNVFMRDGSGSFSWDYGLIFSSLCYAANVDVYCCSGDTFFIIENGERYYTCPKLNAYYQLGLFGVKSINQFTNVAGIDIKAMNDAIDLLNDYYVKMWVHYTGLPESEYDATEILPIDIYFAYPTKVCNNTECLSGYYA